MSKYKHLTIDERLEIAKGLENKLSFKKIAKKIAKDCTTISKEIKNHKVFKQTGGLGRPYNPCIHRDSCEAVDVCKVCTSKRNNIRCRFCTHCISNCTEYKQEHCIKLSKAPYVCNGCPQRAACPMEKHFYNAHAANTEYQLVLSESRTGISLSEDEVKHLDTIVSPLIKRGQSLHHICINNQDSIMVSESTLYRLVDYNAFEARNIDLKRKVRYRPRRVKKTFKVDRSCRIGRTYDDFIAFMKQNPNLPVVEMDSVEGVKGGKVLLTIHFVISELMLAFLRDANDSQSVIDIIDRLYLEMRPDIFMNTIPVLLVDNGSEFTNPKAIEFDQQGNRRCYVFYCNPASPQERGSSERNHEFIREFIPKGTSMNHLTQDNITLMMNHINSYTRKILCNRSAYEMFTFIHGEDVAKSLGCVKIPANEVTLNPSIWEK